MNTKTSAFDVETVDVAQDSTAVRTQFDQERTPASMAVIATLSEVMNTDPVELDPLQSTVDTDALDAIVQVRPGTDSDVRVTFTHHGHEITVRSYGVVTISEEHAPATGTEGRDDGL
jgi:hypothetical protein